MAQIHLDLPDQTIELLFLNKISTTQIYTAAFSSVFDSRWISDKEIKVLCQFVFKYYNTIGKTPTFDLIEQFLIKYSEKSTLDIASTKSKFEEALKLKFVDDTVVNSSLIDFIKRKGLYFAILDNLDRIEAKRDVSNILTTFTNILNISIDQDLGTNWIHDLDDHFMQIKNTSRKLSTGYSEFDDELNGGLLADGKMIWFPVGMPGIGKSALIMNLAFNFFATNKKVAIITMEINEQLYLQRIDALATGVKISSVPTQDIIALKKIKEIANKNPDAGIAVKEYPPRTINTSVIENYLNRLILSGFNPDVIIIDYLNLVNPTNIDVSTGMYERVGAAAQEFRALSYKFCVPVICPTQFNTEGFDNAEPSLKNIAESRAVAHHGDVITSIWQGEGDRESNIINFKHLKNRLGGRIGKKMSLKIDYDTLRMSSLTAKQKSISNTMISNVISGLETM